MQERTSGLNQTPAKKIGYDGFTGADDYKNSQFIIRRRRAQKYPPDRLMVNSLSRLILKIIYMLFILYKLYLENLPPRSGIIIILLIIIIHSTTLL